MEKRRGIGWTWAATRAPSFVASRDTTRSCVSSAWSCEPMPWPSPKPGHNSNAFRTPHSSRHRGGEERRVEARVALVDCKSGDTGECQCRVGRVAEAAGRKRRPGLLWEIRSSKRERQRERERDREREMENPQTPSKQAREMENPSSCPYVSKAKQRTQARLEHSQANRGIAPLDPFKTPPGLAGARWCAGG